MLWNDHSREIREGDHAFLGASKYTWLNDTEEQILDRYRRSYATFIGTVVHEFCSKMIKNKIKMLKGDHHALLLYLLDNGIPRFVIDLKYLIDISYGFVNDAIGYGMSSEQVLYYSDNCFGTADAICFDNKMLRIHDLKTGVSSPSFKQLEIYAAIFCLEYKVDPYKIDIELRIYQGGEYTILNPDPEEISDIMDKIVRFDKAIKSIGD